MFTTSRYNYGQNQIPAVNRVGIVLPQTKIEIFFYYMSMCLRQNYKYQRNCALYDK